MTDIKNADLPANATNLYIHEYAGTINSTYNAPLTGLTKREAFAMAAMQGLLSNGINDSVLFGVPCNEYELLASASVLQADALLKELAK